MLVGDRRVSMRAAYLIAKVISAAPLLFTDEFAFKMMMFLLMAFYLARLQSAIAALVNDNFARRARPLMAASRTDMAAF